MNAEKGLKIMSEMGQPTFVPSSCATFDKLPKDLQKYATKE